MSTSYAHRPNVPAVDQLRLRGDGYVAHDVAVLHLPHATAAIRRHVDAHGDLVYTGHVQASAELAWIDDTTEAAELAEAAGFVARELKAARAAHNRATLLRSIDAAVDRRPAGGAL